MSFQYKATVIACLFTVAMGIFYLVAYHMERQLDDTFRQAFIAGVTITIGSIAAERIRINGNGHK